jgi:hypothetical protein
MPTAVQAEVFAGNPDPLEVLGGGEHLLHQLTVPVLDALPLDESMPRFSRAIGELVPNHLQLTKVEHPRGGRSCLNAVRNLRMTEALADETGELSLEPGDLPPQLQARLALVDRGAYPGKSLFSQQSRHLQKCSHAASRVEAAIHSASSTAI